MRKVISILLSLQIFMIPIMVNAEIITLKKGEVAPFSGSLLDSEAMAKIITDKEYQEKKCLLEKDYLSSNLKAKCDLDLSKIQVERDILQQKYDIINSIKDSENKRLQDLLIKSEKQNSNQMWWIGGGALVGIVTSVAIFFAVSYGSQK